MKKPIRFCTECGNRMIIIDQLVDGFYKYDAITGERLTERILRCPKKGKCWFWELDLHDEEYC